nr:unnamed protein product [Spirometra erinaceieuropaei]
MSQRRRWVLEVHLREKHPGISAESVLGPSPLTHRHIRRSAPQNRGNRAKTVGTVRKTGSKPRTDPRSNPPESPAEEVVVTKREMDHSEDKDASLEESGDDLVVQLKFLPLTDHLLRTKREEEEEQVYGDTDLEDSEGSIIQHLRGSSQTRSPSPSGDPHTNSHTDPLHTQP